MEKHIKDFENYTINDSGDNEKMVFNTVTQKYKKPQQYKKSKYLFVSLFQNGKNKMFLLHRLVAEAFIPNPQNKPQVGHWDCDRTNNKVENLYWCTAQENMDNPLTRKNLSLARQGYTPSDETRKKMSESVSKKIGSLNNFYGKKHSNEFKKNASKRMKETLKNDSKRKEELNKASIIGRSMLFKPKDQIDPITGEVIKTWDDYLEFSLSEYNSACVRRCCKGERKTYKGFIWKRYFICST